MFASTRCVAAPQGTSGAHTTTWTPGRARSAKPAIPAGLSGGTAIIIVLVAKTVGVPESRSSLAALSMVLVSAEANTSAGAPCWSWATRSEEPAKLNSTGAPRVGGLEPLADLGEGGR